MIMTYDDMIHLPHHVSNKHPHMAVSDRAAQFSPFAALTGHNAAIKETARLTEKRVEIDETMKVVLSDKLRIVLECMYEYPQIAITYFKPDKRKNGGAYVTITGTVKRIDEYKRVVIMTGETEIPINEISSIEGQIFENVEKELL